MTPCALIMVIRAHWSRHDFYAQTKMHCGFEAQTTQIVHLPLATKWPLWCRRMSDAPPSFDAYKSFVLPLPGSPLDLSLSSCVIRPTPSPSISSISMYSCFSVHHVDDSCFRLDTSGLDTILHVFTLHSLGTCAWYSPKAVNGHVVSYETHHGPEDISHATIANHSASKVITFGYQFINSSIHSSYCYTKDDYSNTDTVGTYYVHTRTTTSYYIITFFSCYTW